MARERIVRVRPRGGETTPPAAEVKSEKPRYVGCTIKRLPSELHVEAARTAVMINPANLPDLSALPAPLAAVVSPPERLSLITTKWWGADGVRLSVSFLDNPSVALRTKILTFMNHWGAVCNASFAWTASGGDVRVSRGPGGYWSYLGTDIRHVTGQTMNLEGFTESTPDSEFYRVVEHETGHTLGFPHEHFLPGIVEDIDPARAIAWGAQELGWDRQTVIEQILTPLPAGSYRMTAGADRNGIMCYQFPAAITRSGRPIPGGLRIDDTDGAFANTVYPKAVAPPNPPVPAPVDDRSVVEAWLVNAAGKPVYRWKLSL